jgi:methionyl-tRNA synthetase
MNNRYYITTPIYYVNDVPHIGHAYTTVAADVIARFMRLSDKEVMFLTGTDEHGQKVEKSAISRGLSPQEFTDELSMSFQKLMEFYNISNDDFIRTTAAHHKNGVEAFWQKLQDSGNIYLGKYSGWYSVRDEAFYDESELTTEGLAPTGAPVEWVEEPSYFFALSKWQDKLLDFYQSHPEFIRPKSRYNEVVSFVKNGLNDLSISRTSFQWGINVPSDDTHIIYVWLDALTNYISALGYPDETGNFKNFWPAQAHIVGKDIVRFHAVYWPAFLMAAGIALPECIVAHGWWTNEGQKISKSLGNTIDPLKLVEEFGVDQVRYFLMREVIFGSDGNYSRANLINRINSELANKIGNLMQRTLTFIHKNNDGEVPIVSDEYIELAHRSSLLSRAYEVSIQNHGLMKNFDINKVMDNIISITDEANIFIDHEAPWKLKNIDRTKMLEILYILLETLRYIAIMLQPFMPDSASKMLDQLGVDSDERNFEHLTRAYAIKRGSLVAMPYPIFPRVGI